MTSAFLAGFAMTAAFAAGPIQIPGQTKLAAPTSSNRQYLLLEGRPVGIVAVPGSIRPEGFTLEIGMGQTAAAEWMNQFLANKPVPKTAALHAFNARREVTSARQMAGCLITEISFPKLDASDSKAMEYPFRLAIEARANASRAPALRTVPTSAVTAKTWSPSNFRVKIGGLPCERISKVDAFTVKLSRPTEGETAEPNHLEMPKITFSLPAADAAVWRRRLEEQKRRSSHMTGAITFYAPNMSTELFRFQLDLIAEASARPERVGGRTAGNTAITIWARVRGS